MVREVLAGRGAGARDVVLLNAAAAIAAFDGVDATSLTDKLAGALEVARTAIDSGAAGEVLERWIASSRRVQAETSGGH